jgi:hypothetical protein
MRGREEGNAGITQNIAMQLCPEGQLQVATTSLASLGESYRLCFVLRKHIGQERLRCMSGPRVALVRLEHRLSPGSLPTAPH